MVKGDSMMSVYKQVVGSTVVVDAQGEPLVVYRGEHGRHDQLFNIRVASFSFSTYQAAKEYALNPNNRNDKPETSIVIPVLLKMVQPFVFTPDDPFIDYPRLVETVGKNAAQIFFLRYQDHVMNTNAWDKLYAHEFRGIRGLIHHNPELLYDLSIPVWPLLDDPQFVELLQDMGYDGAVYRGSGVTLDCVEYRVFDRGQIYPFTNKIEYVVSPNVGKSPIEFKVGLAHAV